MLLLLVAGSEPMKSTLHIGHTAHARSVRKSARMVTRERSLVVATSTYRGPSQHDVITPIAWWVEKLVRTMVVEKSTAKPGSRRRTLELLLNSQIEYPALTSNFKGTKVVYPHNQPVL